VVPSAGVTVSASAAMNGASAATPTVRRIRPQNSAVRAGTYPARVTDFTSDWHVHDLHQIEYAFDGIVQVETDVARYLLPPQQAIWIPAGLAHRTTRRQVHAVSVFLDPAMLTGMAGRARVLVVEPVFREMLRYAARWPIDRAGCDPLAEQYFDTLAALTTQWLRNESPFLLPVTTDPVVAAAIRYTDDHLATVTVSEVCAAISVSERTLRRRFAVDVAMSWREYLARSRMLRAMALLADPGNTVLSVATKVGFDNAGAFTRAFAAYTGETPTVYRKRTGTTTPQRR
jgi:AraC-like DNA-binding protein